MISRRFAGRVAARLAHLSFLITRPMTLGVRGVVVDPDHRVLLVRHTYFPGWHFPGGGVEVGETLVQALRRELLEEANVELIGPPALHGIFLNVSLSRRDHVAVYKIEKYEWLGARVPDGEIAEARFFPINALPKAVSGATMRRLDEIYLAKPVSAHW